MKRKTVKRYQEGNYIAPQDNTRVVKQQMPVEIRLTPEQQQKIQQRKFQESIQKNKSYVYDADKANYYRNLQSFYNNNFFGYGVFGKQTKHDPSTPEGQAAIQSNFDYAKGNVQNFGENIAMAGIAGVASKAATKGAQMYSKLFKGPFRTPSKRGSLGTMKQYTKNGTLGSGSEAVVINNTPTTVGKITTIPQKEMAARNAIPNTVQSKYVGFVKDKGTKLPTYIQRKVKTLTEDTFPKYVGKLDNAMAKSGFRRVNDPNVQYRAYTNGQVVIDDVAPGNVGLDWLRRPRMIDFNLQSVPEWTAQGFTLRRGGRLIPKAKSGWTAYLNPKNWGVTDYDTKEFSEAFAKAKQNGDKEFLWNGNRYNTIQKPTTEYNTSEFSQAFAQARASKDKEFIWRGNKYHTRLIKPESQKRFDDQYEWIKNRVNNFNLQDVPLSHEDSIAARDYGQQQAGPYQKDYEEGYLDGLRLQKLQAVKDRLNNLDKKQLVVTDEPDPNYAYGYYKPNTGKIYINLNSPGTAVHELAHWSNLDKFHNIKPNTNQTRDALIMLNNNYDQAQYLLQPNEIGARLYQNQYLIGNKNFDEAKPIIQRNPVDAVLYNKDNFNTYFK